jgi:predicted nucleotidyltransferase
MAPHNASGRFLLRVDPGLHAALRASAAAAGTSLNEYCVRKLAAPDLLAGGPAAEVVARCAGQVGGALAGIVAFGSWARSNAAAGSDLDLLIVVDGNVRLTRSLYRPWDVEPAMWDGHRIEPHFVHRPPEDERPSPLWLEVAIDGLLLFDRGLEASRMLAGVRRFIVEAGMRRQWSHGQPYWLDAA